MSPWTLHMLTWNEQYRKTYFDTSLYQLIFLVRFTEDADIKRDQSEDELLNAHHTIKERHVIAVLHFSHSMIFNNGHWSDYLCLLTYHLCFKHDRITQLCTGKHFSIPCPNINCKFGLRLWATWLCFYHWIYYSARHIYD